MENCNAVCVFILLMDCVFGDGCCFESCIVLMDIDCADPTVCEINIQVECVEHFFKAVTYWVSVDVLQGILIYNTWCNMSGVCSPDGELVNWCLNDTGVPAFPFSDSSGCIYAFYEIGECFLAPGATVQSCEGSLCYECP